MSAFDAVAHVVGEGATYAAGRLVGHAFKIERERSICHAPARGAMRRMSERQATRS